MDIEKALEVFTLSVLESSVMVYSQLEKFGFTIDDLDAFVKDRQKNAIMEIAKLEGKRSKALEA